MPRPAILYALTLGLLLAACSDPKCPRNMVQTGNVCRRCEPGFAPKGGVCRAVEGDAEAVEIDEDAEVEWEEDGADADAERDMDTGVPAPPDDGSTPQEGPDSGVEDLGLEDVRPTLVACSANPCGPHGTSCADSPGGAVCTCAPLWAGPNCQVERNPPLGASTALAFDAATQRLISADAFLRAVTAFNLATREHSILSGNGVGGGPRFVDPRGLAVSPNLRVGYVADRGMKAIVGVNLAYGIRKVVSSAEAGSARGTGPAFIRLGGLALFSEQSLLVSDTDLAAVVQVSIATGNREVVSSATTGFARGAGPAFAKPCGVAAADAGHIYVLDCGLNAIFAVDSGSGDRRLLSGIDGDAQSAGSGPTISTAYSLSFDPLAARLLLSTSQGAMTVDPTSGARAFVTARGGGVSLGSGPGLISGPLTADPAGQRVFTASRADNAFLAVALSSGDRSALSRLAKGAAPEFWNPSGIALQPGTGKAHVCLLSTGGVSEVDLVSAAAMDAVGSFCRLVASDANGTIRSIAYYSGSIYANGGIVATPDRSLSQPLGFAIDTTRGRALVSSADAAGAIIAVSLADGKTTSFASGLGSVGRLASDESRGRAYAIINGGISSFDLTTGVQFPLPGGSGPSVATASSLFVDPTGNRLFVIDETADSIFAINLATGTRSVVTSPDRGLGLYLARPTDLILDAPRNRLVVVDSDLLGLVAVDLTSGDRTVLVKSGVAAP